MRGAVQAQQADFALGGSYATPPSGEGVERLHFHDPKTAPAVFDVVWCKWPMRERPGMPGDIVRCVLVLDVRLMVDTDDAEWAAVTVTYGTGADNVPEWRRTNHLLIGNGEYRALGLHKPTIFKLDLGNRKRLPWAEEYFVPQVYVRSQGIVAGSLNAAQQVEAIRCIRAHGGQFPLP